MARAVGIDLGTTNSAIAVLEVGQACLRVGSAHAREATGLVNASPSAQVRRFC